MESAKFPVCQENIQKKNLIRYYIDFNDADERDFQLQCVEELESIKRKEIGVNYETEFPIYASILKSYLFQKGYGKQ